MRGAPRRLARLLLALLLPAFETACVEPETPPSTDVDDAFATTRLPRLHLDFPPASFVALARCTRTENTAKEPPAHCDYQPATFRYEDDDGQYVALEPVGVRLKGRTTFRRLTTGSNSKPAFKIKLDEHVAGVRFAGLRRLTLNNLTQDPTLVRECLAYRIYGAVGAPAPRCSFVRLYVDGDYFGLYANLETLDDVFVADRYGAATGELYDTYNDVYFTDLDRRRVGGAVNGGDRGQAGPDVGLQEQRFERELGDDDRHLTALIDAVYVDNAGDDADQLLASVEPLVDLDELLRVAAAQAFLSDWDGFFGARNNYKLYRDPATDRFELLPWGVDQTFGYQDRVYRRDWNYPIDHHRSRREPSLLARRCFRYSAACSERYRAIVAEVLAQVREHGILDEPATVTLYDGTAIELPAGVPLMSDLGAMLALVEDAIAEDTRRPLPSDDDSIDSHAIAIENLIDYLARRPGELDEQLGVAGEPE